MVVGSAVVVVVGTAVVVVPVVVVPVVVVPVVVVVGASVVDVVAEKVDCEGACKLDAFGRIGSVSDKVSERIYLLDSSLVDIFENGLS